MIRRMGRVMLPAVLAFMVGTHVLAGQGLPQARSGESQTDEADPERTITVDGRQRSYLLHRPQRGSGKPMGLVLVFHGGTETGADAARISGFDRQADRAGFVVAYPNGVGKRWSDGRGTTAPDKQGVDDVAFVRALVRDVGKSVSIDPGRVFAAGMSNGAFLAHRLGCEMSDVLAAIGPVIGSMPSSLAGRCHPQRPIAVLAIQGAADPLVPIAGGEEGGPRHLGEGGQVEPAEATYRAWAERNGCSKEPKAETLPDRVSDGTSVERISYGGCREHADVVFYRVAGMGHRWPSSESAGRRKPLIDRLLGPSSGNIDATATIVRFFEEHGRSSPSRSS
jgi:polyhydroxybutyrate depolymerase